MASSSDPRKYGYQQPQTVRRIYTRVSRETVRSSPAVSADEVGEDQGIVVPVARSQRLTFGTQNHEISMTFNGTIVADNRIIVRFPTPLPVMSQRLVQMLDHIEKRVEILRESAYAIEHEKEALLSMIHTIQNNKELNQIRQDEKEEIELTADRLVRRTLTVEVAVTTPRNEFQEQALEKVTHYLDNVLDKARTDLSGAKSMCQAYLNCCLPDYQGPIDQRFQSYLIECAADDQKKTRKRLESILTTIKHAENQSSPH